MHISDSHIYEPSESAEVGGGAAGSKGRRMKSRAIFAALAVLAIGLSVRVNAATPSPSPSPTPNPYRSLDFAAAALGATSGPIAVLGGFAAVKRDGKGAIVCVSFKNTGATAARRVVFDFALEGARGRELATLHLDRRGEFTSGIDIHGWSDLKAWQDGVGHRGYGDNCTTLQQGVAAAPLLHAAGVVFTVARIEFAGGTDWP